MYAAERLSPNSIETQIEQSHSSSSSCSSPSENTVDDSKVSEFTRIFAKYASKRELGNQETSKAVAYACGGGSYACAPLRKKEPPPLFLNVFEVGIFLKNFFEVCSVVQTLARGLHAARGQLLCGPRTL